MLTVTRKRKPINFPYRVHGNELSLCNAEKDLGLPVSSDLKWGPHILKTVAKANKCLVPLNDRGLKLQTPKLVQTPKYLTLVRSQLTYGCEVWCPSSRQLPLKIEGVQRSQACKTTTFQSSYFVRIVNLWNYVCKTAPSNSFNTLFSFKTYLHKTYLQLTATAYDPDLPSSHSLITTE